ncbi:amino acid adenylation domain-containing protein [Streptomyces sp. NPDC026589]|uniref:non-ribosomal peptide synthetase n=1 Tax=Streptomyces sp. NPDC026589 TaxID=3155609 RepID=UPI0033D3EAF2
MIEKENIQSVSGLAAMQKSMFFSYAVDTNTDAYVEQFDFAGSGAVDAEYLSTALGALSQHYSVLRTIFSFRNTDEPYQIVLKEWAPTLEVIDYSELPESGPSIAAFKKADRTRGFDLTRDVLLRATLIRTGEESWHLIFTFHHIILDGWSLGPLFGTLFRYYAELVRSGEFEQQYESRPYSDYITWYERQRDDDAQQYWADILEGYERAASLVPDQPHPGQQPDGYRGVNHRFTLPDELHDGLKRFAQQAHLTQSAVFQAAWGVVLQKFTYSEDVVFGTVVSGRGIDLEGVEDMLGLFVNTQPLRVTTQADQDFIGLCRTVYDSYRRANPYEYFPLYETQRLSRLKSDLLDHFIAFENYPLSDQMQTFGGDGAGGLRFEGVDVMERTSYDLAITVNPGHDFAVTFTYNADRYSSTFMETLERSLVRVLSSGIANPIVPVREIAIEDHAGPSGPADPAPSLTSMPLDSSLISVFKHVVERRGDETALVWHDKEYTYRTLDRWSDAVAWQLSELGMGAGQGIGLLSDRRPHMIAAMLGILKIGGHYVPIDTKDAMSRVEYILSDAGVPLVCTVPDFNEQVPGSVKSVLVDEPAEEVPPFPWCHEADAAYLMYTSGSTGDPKGCVITHRNIVRLVSDQKYFDFDREQVMLQSSSPAFDVCTFEVWGTLLAGAKLVLPDELDILDGDRLRELLGRHQVRSMWLTSPLFNQLCDHDPTTFASLDHLLVGGSALSVPHIAKARRACPDLRITNGYGPTENTAFSTTHAIVQGDLLGSRIPIGRALAHSTAYVLDSGLNLLPPGAIGELCVGGEGVSAGYHNRPDLNNARFVTSPALPGERIYRTGDLARMLPNGAFDYLGRVDDQVKIDGFRVELGEIESVLRSLDTVEDGVVIAVENGGEKRLHGYYVAARPVSSERIRQELAHVLAGYMVPAVLVPVDRLPLNKSGKVDRHRLKTLRLEPGTEQEAPGSRDSSWAEQQLQDIVADVLSSSKVDVHQNFFELGITSLNLLAINNRLRKALGRNLPLRLYFEHNSISSLAAHIEFLTTEKRSAPDWDAADTEHVQDHGQKNGGK